MKGVILAEGGYPQRELSGQGGCGRGGNGAVWAAVSVRCLLFVKAQGGKARSGLSHDELRGP